MLILQIALGIVWGILLLAFLPSLLEFGGNLLLIVISLVLVWIAVGFLFENPVLLAIAILVIVTTSIYWWYLKNFADEIKIKDLEKHINERKRLGYEPQQESEELLLEMRKILEEKNNKKKQSMGALGRIVKLQKYKTEKERRKSLGYEE